MGVDYSVSSGPMMGDLVAMMADFIARVSSMAHVCVSTTARQAAEKGYDVVVAEDAVGDRDIPGVKAEDLVKTSLAELGDAFGTVVKSADIN